MLKRLGLLCLAVFMLTGCQGLSDTQTVQDALLNFYPTITSIQLTDANIPQIVWNNPSVGTREVAGAEIFVKSPKDTTYSATPAFTVTSNVSYFSSKKIFKDGFGSYKIKMVSVDKEGTIGTFSDEYEVRFSGFHKSLQVISSVGGGDSFNQPFGMARDSKGNLYVVDTGKSRILKLNSEGLYVTTFGSEGSSTGHFQNPYGIWIDSQDHVFVADSGNDRIVYFDPANFLDSFKTLGSYGSELGQFNSPYACCVAGDVLYVTDVNNNRIQAIPLTTTDTIWDPDNIQLFAGSKTFVSLWGITCVGKTIYVVDKGANTIFSFNSNGELTGSIASEGKLDGELLDPRNIFYDVTSDHLFVANHGNHSIDVFKTDGVFVERWGEEGTAAGQLRNPIAVTIYKSKAYVLERGNSRLQIFKL
jgi:DNA-binding beta-propeller fold protein YncE